MNRRRVVEVLAYELELRDRGDPLQDLPEAQAVGGGSTEEFQESFKIELQGVNFPGQISLTYSFFAESIPAFVLFSFLRSLSAAAVPPANQNDSSVLQAYRRGGSTRSSARGGRVRAKTLAASLVQSTVTSMMQASSKVSSLTPAPAQTARAVS